MPELPEVETIRRGLTKFVIKQKITKVEVLCEKSFQNGGDDGGKCGGDGKNDGKNGKNCGKIIGAPISQIRRYGKALIIDLKSGMSLMIHLRMTGQLIYDPDDFEDSDIEGRFAAGHPSENFVDRLPNKQTRVILRLEKGTLYFNDQRKFGFIKVIPTGEVENDAFIKKLAPEPWKMQPEEFYEKLQKHKNSPIKAVILDQTIICGLGNIYADESLFKSKIHPETKAGVLSQKQAETLLKMAANVMDLSIESGGSTMKDYVKADGTRGDYLDKFAQVFNRQGQPCPVCGTEIVKIRVAGRGTHICPHCQKLPGSTDGGEGVGVRRRGKK